MDGWESRKEYIRKYFKKLRRRLVILLGGKCSCPGKPTVDCWHKGPCQVDDPRCVQVEHINGGGTLEFKKRGSPGLYLYYLRPENRDEAKEKLQPHCANCNWVKRDTNHEVRNGKVIYNKTQ